MGTFKKTDILRIAAQNTWTQQKNSTFMASGKSTNNNKTR